MSKVRFTLNILAVTILTLTVASMAQAQATRTWVSGVGDDVNPCSRTAPCKTFAGAISKTFTNGEINVIDSGGFGTITITKSITIDGTGSHASILASGVNGVNINIATGNANDPLRQVTLRRLSINGAGASGTVGTRTGINGINVNTNGAAVVLVEDTFIQNFSQNGVNVNTSANSTFLMLRNVTIRSCGQAGIRTLASGTNQTPIGFDNINVSSCADGLRAENGTSGSIRGSTFSLNSGNGIITSQTTSPTFVNIDASLITGSTTGINTGAGTRARIARMLISQNANALGLTGSVDTGGNNTIMGNNTNQDPNGTAFIQK